MSVTIVSTIIIIIIVKRRLQDHIYKLPKMLRTGKLKTF